MRRHRKRVGLAVLGVLVACSAQALLSGMLADLWGRRAARDPETGVLVGAEARDLGPEDAACAALLVHGFLGAGNNFADLPEQLAAHGWRVRVMRLPGHGTTPRDLARTTAKELEHAVSAEARALREHHETVALIGHSMGGALCTLAAAEGEADAVVLAAPYFGVTHHWYYLLRPEQWVALTHHFVPWTYKGSAFVQVNRKEARKQILTYKWVPAQALVTLMAIGKKVRSPEVLASVQCPVLLIHSRADQAACPEAAARAFDAMPSARKRAVWLETSNHIIFWDLERQQVAEEILDFLGGLSGSPAQPK